jgi:hypothetical protein
MRFQASIGLALMAALLFCFDPGGVAAGGRIHTLNYRGGGHGKVVFDHQLHASKGFRCVDCHTDFAGTGKILFATRKQGLITVADHTSGTKCFACHNHDSVPAERRGADYTGKGSFDDCDRCHRKTGGF